jgi:hypothetical protein
MSNEDRAAAVEHFLLQEAVGAGVVKEIKITSPKKPQQMGKNPCTMVYRDLQGGQTGNG